MIHHTDFIAHSTLLATISPTGIRLGWLDISVIALPLLLAFVLTLYMRRFTGTVASYLAAGRSAGRYLICTAQMEMGLTAAGVAGAMETFSKAGYSTGLWLGFTGFI